MHLIPGLPLFSIVKSREHGGQKLTDCLNLGMSLIDEFIPQLKNTSMLQIVRK